MNTTDRVTYLVARYLSEKLTEEELLEFSDWRRQHAANEQLIADISNPDYIIENISHDEAIKNRIREKIDVLLGRDNVEGFKSPPKIFRFYLKWAVAVFCLVTTTVLFFWNFKEKKEDSIPVAVKDILPATSGALLTRSDGSIIQLESLPDGDLNNEGGTKISKVKGSLTYLGSKGNNENIYNVVTTPRGKTFKITLSDGSTIQMNANSSLRYGVAFTKSERVVELTGEALFVVAKDKSRPFRVKYQDMEVAVTGTKFLVNCYKPLSRATLLEGSIRVTNGKDMMKLKPGQQVNKIGNELKLEVSPNVKKETAWLNNSFYFDKTPIEEVFEELGRWYDVDVVFAKGLPREEITGRISRSESLMTLMDILQSTLPVKINYTLENRKLTINH